MIADPLVDIFNNCISQNIFIREWKTAIVTPLYKSKGDVCDVNNYRGISVVPPLAKIFEKLLAARLKSYFETNNLLFHGQHGFRSAHSCETAIHEIVTSCFKNLDRKLINLPLFIDFKKAFDMIDQQLLLYKLLNYGLSNNALNLMKHYFTNRFQMTKINGIESNLLK